MAFQFQETEAIAAQIAQLQEQLNKLTAAIAPLRECEQQAAELLEQVTNHTQLMRGQGIENQSLIEWANQMYLVITGVSTSALYQEISDLKSSNKVLRQEREQLENRLNIYKQDTQEIDSYAHELQQLRQENADYQARYEGQKSQKEQWESDYYKIRAQRDEFQRQLQRLEKQVINEGDSSDVDSASPEKEPCDDNRELTPIPDSALQQQQESISSSSFIKDDIVQHSNGQVGTITYVPKPFNGIVSVEMVNGNFNYHTENLTLISRPSKGSSISNSSTKITEIEVQAKAIEFINSIKTKSATDEVTWTTIRSVCQGDIRVLREISLAAKTKPHKQLIENLPELIAEYIKVTGDDEDLNWVGNTLKNKAEERLQQKRSAQINSILEVAGEAPEVNLLVETA